MMDREECLLELHLAFQERRPVRLVSVSGYTYYGALVSLGRTQPDAQTDTEIRFLMLDGDGEAQATVTLLVSEVQEAAADDPQAAQRLSRYICRARGYAPRLRSIREIVQQLRDRPGLFIGSASVMALRQYIAGYLTACTDVDPLWQDAFSANAFTLFVCHEYGQKMSGRDWASLICERFPDDGSAFDEFLRLFDQFCAE